MDRRSFLTSLSAACAALSSGLVASKPAKATVAANTEAFRRTVTDSRQGVDDFRRQVLAMLKDCEVVRIDDCFSVGAAKRVTIIYRYSPRKPRGPQAYTADRIAAIGNPVSMTAMTTMDNGSLPHLGQPYTPITTLRPIQEITIDWVY
jgi:hypothetical protein